MEASPCERRRVQQSTGQTVIHMVRHMTEDSPGDHTMAAHFDLLAGGRPADTSFKVDVDEYAVDTSLESVIDDPVQVIKIKFFMNKISRMYPRPIYFVFRFIPSDIMLKCQY